MVHQNCPAMRHTKKRSGLFKTNAFASNQERNNYLRLIRLDISHQVLHKDDLINQWSPNFSSRGPCIDFLDLLGPKRETKQKKVFTSIDLEFCYFSPKIVGISKTNKKKVFTSIRSLISLLFSQNLGVFSKK